jgi:hypothetical protein
MKAVPFIRSGFFFFKNIKIMAINFNATKNTGLVSRLHTIPLEVRRHYTDVNGVVLAKNDALIPAVLQTFYPVFLLGEFDRQGGYPIGLKTKPVANNNIFYLTTFVHGSTGTPQMIVGFNGLNTIQNRIRIGDIVSVYTDSLSAPSIFVWIVVSNNACSIASILGNSETTQNDSRLGSLFVYEINYKTDVDAQLNEALHFTRFDNIGNAKDNQVQPKGMFRTPNDVQTNLVKMTTSFNIDQFLGINFYMIYACDVLTFDFKIKKIN